VTPLKLFIALGTRPEAIKLAPVILAARANAGVAVTVCNTGQHRVLARDMLKGFGITADLDLGVMREGQSLTELTTNVLSAIELPLRNAKPDWVIVQGDTTTSFVAALAAFYQKIPVAHVEAGLRTGDRYSPWPEEINRRLNTRLASAHFAPTEQSRNNLLAEGVCPDRILVTGNTGIDALHLAIRRIDEDAAVLSEVASSFHGIGLDILSPNNTGKLVVVTAHRRENFGEGIAAICRAIVALARRHPELRVVFPVHPNPEVTGPVDSIVRPQALPNIFAVAPLDYFPFAALLSRARLVISDSGGLQEESIALGKRLVILRHVTERVELLGQPGANVVGTDEAAILCAAESALSEETSLRPSALFGDGIASIRIIGWLNSQR
jgi:UDP-N-acetylglucosamine 2-epimerase